MANDYCFTTELIEEINRRLDVEEDALIDAVYNELEPNVAADEDEIINYTFHLARLMMDGVTKETPRQALMRIPNVLRNILMGVPLCPITDNPNEWEELPDALADFVEKQNGNVFWFTTDHLEGTCIEVTCIEENIRYPMIRRFNHDSRTAHRIDAIAYYDATSEEPKQLDPRKYPYSTMRFIPIPYVWGPPIQIYIDPESGTVDRSRTAGMRGDEMDGTPIPKYIQDIIGEDSLTDDVDWVDEDDEEDEMEGELPDEPSEEQVEAYKSMANGILSPIFSALFKNGMPSVDEPEEEDQPQELPFEAAEEESEE